MSSVETRVMAKRFVVISDAQYALAITKFLVNDLGLYPAKQYITDDTPLELQPQVAGYFQELNYGIGAEVGFDADGYAIHEEIKNTDYFGYPLILGRRGRKRWPGRPGRIT